MLYLIGLGLGKRSISVEGFEIVKKCKKVYLEDYTSVFEMKLNELEDFFGKKIIEVDRDFVEKQIKKVFMEAKRDDVAFLVIGDVYSASTHIDLYLRAIKEKVEVKVINGVSIFTGIGITGLNLYNFGKTISIPFNNENVKSAYENLKKNYEIGLHTLFLLDLDPKNDRFLTIKEACDYLLRNKVKKETLAVGCARLGFENFKIKKGTLDSLRKENFGEAPYCLIIPGKLHFIEEEALELLG